MAGLSKLNKCKSKLSRARELGRASTNIEFQDSCFHNITVLKLFISLPVAEI